MKILSFILLFSCCSGLSAQNKVLLPYSGAVCEKSGISCKEIDLELEDQTWISNILPIGKKLSVTIEDPTGFVIEQDQCFPGVSILVSRLNGDTLGYAPNIFSESEGLDVSTLSNLSFSFSLEEDVKAGEQCRLDARFFDTKSSNYLRVKLDFKLGAEEEKQISEMVYSYSSTNSYRVSTTIDVSDVKVLDSLVKNKAYRVFRIKNTAISYEELLALQESMKLYAADFTLLDPQNFPGESFISKRENPVTKKYDLELCVPKNNDIGAAYWLFKLENTASQQVIEIFNPF